MHRHGKAMSRYPDPDLVTGYNNGTMALQPVEGGRLSHLVKKNPDGTEKCWVFGDVSEYKWGNVETFDHVRRGVLAGTLEEGRRIIKDAEALGLKVNHGMYVPFSNGQTVSAKIEYAIGKRGDNEPRDYLSDYEMFDLGLARVDVAVLCAAIDAMDDEPERLEFLASRD
jgi:hypothetical protein